MTKDKVTRNDLRNITPGKTEIFVLPSAKHCQSARTMASWLNRFEGIPFLDQHRLREPHRYQSQDCSRMNRREFSDLVAYKNRPDEAKRLREALGEAVSNADHNVWLCQRREPVSSSARAVNGCVSISTSSPVPRRWAGAMPGWCASQR